MMRINSFILMFLLLTKNASAQIQDKYDCSILKAILKNKEVIEKFNINYSLDKHILLIDNKFYFQHCNLGNVHEKAIEISSDSSLMNSRNFKGILISSIVQSENRTTVYLYQKSTGAAGNVKLVKRRNKYSVIDVRIGNY